MKAMKHHQATLSKFSEKSFLIKMATKILLPVSIFSIIFSYSSLVSFLEFLLQFFSFSFSEYSKQLSGYSIDKNYIFLLCNGILVFIVKNSGAMNKSQEEETDLNYAKIDIKQRDSEQQLQVVKLLSEEKVDHMEVVEAQETEQRSCVVVAAETVVSVAQDEKECRIIDEDEEGGTELISTEELNKKCDDFIRKMKEVIKFEAQQLIMV